MRIAVTDSGNAVRQGAPHPLTRVHPLPPEARREEILSRLQWWEQAGLSRLEARCVALAAEGLALGQIVRRVRHNYRTVRAAVATGCDRLVLAERRAAAAVLPLVANRVLRDPLEVDVTEACGPARDGGANVITVRMNSTAEDDRIRLHPDMITVEDMVEPLVTEIESLVLDGPRLTRSETDPAPATLAA